MPQNNPPSQARDRQAIDPLAEVSARLLQSAEGTLHASEISGFVQLYRDWITLERGELGTQQEQADQWQMLVNCMVNAPTIGEAIAQLLHFAPVVWGERAPTALRDEGDNFALVFNEPYRPGAEGLVAAIWMQSLLLSTLEFLATARLAGASGRVLHANLLPDGVARLLFGAPVSYDQDEVALLVPRRHLRRPVAVRPSDLPQFFRQILPLTLGAARAVPDMQTMVAGLIHDQKQGPEYRDVSRGHVAAMLGLSEATMHRRLAGEGVTYRSVRDAVFTSLAREWLEHGDVPVAAIAARLGFSDAFAFRRFFTRLTGESPSAYRKRASM